jgi:hypothetical protein
VVASGGFEFYCPKPDKLSFEIDKIFGLVKADNSVLKFRMVITGVPRRRRLEVNLMYLGVGCPKYSKHLIFDLI